MISRRSAFAAALVLCALASCAFPVANVSAAGLTAVTCKEVGPGGSYSSSHCETPQSEGSFETTAIALNTTTEVEGKSTGEEPTLTAVATTGFLLSPRCETSQVIGGAVKNEEPKAGVHTISGTATRVTFTGCRAVNAEKPSRFCAIKGVTAPGGPGDISTTALRLTATGVEHKVKVEPQEGTILTEYNVLAKGSAPTEENECPMSKDMVSVLKGYVEGEVSTTNHSHLTFNASNNGTGLLEGGGTVNYLNTVGFNMASEPEGTVGAQTFT